MSAPSAEIDSNFVGGDAPMIREIGGVVMACDPDGLFGDGCQRDAGAMALRFVMGMEVSLGLGVVAGLMMKGAAAPD